MCTPSRRLLSRTLKLVSSAAAVARCSPCQVWHPRTRFLRRRGRLRYREARSCPSTSAGSIPFLVSTSWAIEHKAVDVIDTDTKKVKQFTPGFVGFTGNNDTSGPDGVITVDHKELWVGDGQSRVWVLNPHSGTPIHVPKGATNPILTSPANEPTGPMSSVTIQMIIS